MNAIAPIVTPPSKPVGAVTAALAILRCLGRHRAPLRLSDIAREEGINTSTALNILRTLEFEGLVAFDRFTKLYALAQGLADLAAPLAERDDPIRRVMRAMAGAAYELDATIGLWRRMGDEVELIHVAEHAAAMRVTFTIGRRLPMFLGAMGRLVAARGTFDEDAMARHFAAVRWSVAPAYDTWRSEVAAAREAGAAIDPGNVNQGLLGVAVPVERDGPLVHIVAAVMFDGGQPDTEMILQRLHTVADAAAG